MWAQAMVEHGLLSGAVAGIEAAQSECQFARRNVRIIRLRRGERALVFRQVERLIAADRFVH